MRFEREIWLEEVAAELDWLEYEVMFFGAGVLPLYFDGGPGSAPQLRPTEDVDVLVGIGRGDAVQRAVRELEEGLRARRWRVDLRPRRRNIHAYLSPGGVAVDLVIDALYETFPHIRGPKKEDICYATQNRHDAVKQLAERCDLH